MLLKRCLPPVTNSDIRLLILGSLPGERSLAQDQYYANPQNQFWRLISGVIEYDLVELDYHARLGALLENRIGLWDVIAEAKRKGSLDSDIKSYVQNELLNFIRGLPQLNAIAFNGGAAARIGLKQLKVCADRYHIIQLPSSSPAYTLSYLQKLNSWQKLKEYVV